MQRALVSVLAATAVLVGFVAPAAGAAGGEQHCYVRVVDRKADGELVTSPPRCYTTEAARDRAVLATTRTKQAGVGTQSGPVLATHYDGPNHGGGSTSVLGNDCNGGWLNTDSYWSAEMELMFTVMPTFASSLFRNSATAGCGS